VQRIQVLFAIQIVANLPKCATDTLDLLVLVQIRMNSISTSKSVWTISFAATGIHTSSALTVYFRLMRIVPMERAIGNIRNGQGYICPCIP
jgi:hypothetical protein